ncbi:hypothetical protein EDC96DRAFT_545332 [Choanephora cucurbitarum]|nr:hypothetical protein EDC96DRAFT_545332 [Choanephora cucurbitarum]
MSQQSAVHLSDFNSKTLLHHFSKLLHEVIFGVISNIKTTSSINENYQPTHFLVNDQFFFVFVAYEVSEVIETESGEDLCVMNDITYGVIGCLHGEHCLCNKRWSLYQAMN